MSAGGLGAPAPAAPSLAGTGPRAVVAFVGPDGSGKTTLIDTLLETHLAGAPVLRIRRPGILPRRTQEGIEVTEPHAHSPYPLPVSLAKVTYLMADELLGWVLRIRPYVRRGGTVIIERGWWDLAADPRRYRLSAPAGMLWWLGRRLPRPDLLLVLEASPEVLSARKTELTRAELVRQTRVWRERLPARQRRVYLDAAASPERVVAAAAAELAGARAQPESPSSWAGLSDGGQGPRWVVPRGPRRVAVSGLHVYQPINLKAQVGWDLLRVAASCGLLRLLPRSAAPPPAVAEVMGPHLGPEDTLAVARTNHAGRWVALVVGPRGQRRALGKVATDVAGRAGLEAEARSLLEFGARLEAPLVAPGILARRDGLLLFEVAEWHARLRPWRLEADVARAAGRFFRAGTVSGDDTGLAHGDFAPWNLLRGPGRWTLLDWEYVREDAPPFFDLWHHLVQGCVLLGRPSEEAILAGWRRPGWVADAITAYAAGAELAPEDAARWLGPYLELSRSDLDPGKPDGAAGLRARERLGARLVG